MRAVIFFLFAAAYFLSYFYRSANAVIASDLSQDLSLTAAQLGLMTSLFYVSFALIQLPLGGALDRYGPRLATPLLMIVGALGSLVFALAPSFAVLALGRALIGVGMAGVLMGALKAFSAWFSPARFATISGLFMGLGATGAIAAATPLAYFNLEFGWRTVFFWAALPTGLVALSIMLFTRNAPSGTPEQAESAREGLSSVFKDARFWRVAPLGFFLAGTMLAVQSLWGGPYLVDAHGLSTVETGNLLTLMAFGVILGFLSLGYLADRFGLGRMIVLMMSVFLLCQLLLALPGLGYAYGLLGAIYLVLGFSGSSNMLLFAVTRELFPPSLTGRAVTAINLFGISGSALLQWLMGVLINLFAADALGRYPPGAYTLAFGFTAFGGLLAFLWYLPMTRRSA